MFHINVEAGNASLLLLTQVFFIDGDYWNNMNGINNFVVGQVAIGVVFYDKEHLGSVYTTILVQIPSRQEIAFGIPFSNFLIVFDRDLFSALINILLTSLQIENFSIRYSHRRFILSSKNLCYVRNSAEISPLQSKFCCFFYKVKFPP